MATDPLTTTVLDLDSALGGNADLILGGGLGLYLKQLHLEEQRATTLLPATRWPRARATQDIDLFLKAEVVADPSRMSQYRAALDRLGFEPVEYARWMKFVREVAGQIVFIDLMVGPLGSLESQVERRNVRVKPTGSAGLHARAADDALAVEHNPIRLELKGQGRSCHVLVPQAFAFAMMKLGALRDRIDDTDKDEGRHHALDLYRIVAMLTEEEDAMARELAKLHAGNSALHAALQVIDELIANQRGIGRLRLREHPLCPQDADADWLASELRRLLSP